MKKPITIILDEETIKKLRDIQARKIKITNNSVSFSTILNEVIKKGLKK